MSESLALSPELTAPGEALAGTARALYARGWMEGTSGNLSVRLPGGLAAVTPSGRSKGEMSAADMVAVDVATGEVRHAGGARPSAETAIHLALYRSFPDCGAVVHAHIPHGTALSSRVAIAGLDSASFAHYEIIKGLGGPHPEQVTVPVFANWADVSKIGDDVRRFYAGATKPHVPVLLIAHHGATTWGPDLETARNRLECLELLCQQHLLVHR
ncbi:methylthioribulose 1-phosphate dehydratase [Gandjariella thermophila]|uniref:Methylthioribulose-1-phosphate dehydratase n=1 Tax=Gandjariella thermophila TaxID=1931992 RepID=A0A4D4J2Q3_9PSEU|nr:methylthioribulose 1-phosphate dehydratase [Gandjariella thermophila]GDY29068.1 methylthioribulose-1-phosphate dehydratase [Gandjariella thermophila]